MITPRGDLDAAAVRAELGRPAAWAVGEGYQHVVIDFYAVRFIDTTSMSVLVDLHHAITRRGGRLVLVHVGPQMRRYLEITGLAEVLELDE